MAHQDTTAIQSNPTASMKSTWRRGDRAQWNTSQWLLETFNAHPFALDKPIPVHSKEDKIPYTSPWHHHLWILWHALVPLAIEQAWLSFTQQQSLNSLAIFGIYFTSFNFTLLHEVSCLRRLAHKHGFLDGDVHGRDDVPDMGATKALLSVFKTTGSRMIMNIALTYNSALQPKDAVSDWSWWLLLPLQLGLYVVILDFWFYWYHRLMHEVPFLWKFHRTHHLTKHPTPLLTAYADEEQELFDSVGIPFLAYGTLWAIGLPLGFYGWWICHQYIVYTEAWGHSGLRIYYTPPNSLNWLLQLLSMELIIEDHDLHHRHGWRKSQNYGKQTRIWDRLFGTCGERIELVMKNIDYVDQAYMPII